MIRAARAIDGLLGCAAAAMPALALAQGQVVSQENGWPLAWILFFFAIAALAAVLAFVILAVRWRSNPPRPRPGR